MHSLAQTPRRWTTIASALFLAAVGCWSMTMLGQEKPPQQLTGDQADAAREDNDRGELMRVMRQRAEGTKVYRVDDGARTEVELQHEPLFQYADQPRRIISASLWGWGTSGRPTALHKVEVYRRAGPRPVLHCFTSLSEGLVEAEWQEGEQWESKEPGLVFKPLADGPKPAASKVARLAQMKELTRRFESTISDDVLKTREEMRLLSRPICRYLDPPSGLLDGAIFGFTTSGTNPDALLAIEARASEGSDAGWHYALARMTTGGLAVRLDKNEVWAVPFVYPSPSGFETWVYFYGRSVPALEAEAE